MTPTEPQIWKLLLKLRSGGSLVRAQDCSREELALATSEGRYSLDKDGFAYVWRVPEKR